MSCLDRHPYRKAIESIGINVGTLASSLTDFPDDRAHPSGGPLAFAIQVLFFIWGELTAQFPDDRILHIVSPEFLQGMDHHRRFERHAGNVFVRAMFEAEGDASHLVGFVRAIADEYPSSWNLRGKAELVEDDLSAGTMVQW